MKKKYKIYYTNQEGGEVLITALAIIGLASKAAIGKAVISSVPIITHAGSHIYLAAHSHTSMALAHNLLSSSATHGITSTAIHSIFTHSTVSGIMPFHAHTISKGLEYSITTHFGGIMTHPAMIHTNSMLTHRGYSALSNNMFSTNTAQLVTSIPPGYHASYLHSFMEFILRSGIVTGNAIESTFFSLTNLNAILYGIFLAKIYPLFYALLFPILNGELDVTTLFSQNPTIMITPDIVTFQSITSSVIDLFFLNESFKSVNSTYGKLVKDLMPDKNHFISNLNGFQTSLNNLKPEDIFMNYNDENNHNKNNQTNSYNKIKIINLFDIFNHDKLFLNDGKPNILNWHKTDIIKLVFEYFNTNCFTFHQKTQIGILGASTVKDDIKVNIGFYYKIIDGLKDVFLFKRIVDDCYKQQTFMSITEGLFIGKAHPYSVSCGSNSMTYWNCSIHSVALTLLHHDIISGCFTSIFASIFTLGFSDILICAFKKFPNMTWISSLANVEVKDVEGITEKTINCSSTDFELNLCPAYIINYSKVYIASFIEAFSDKATEIITDTLNENDREKAENEQKLSNNLININFKDINSKSAKKAEKSIKNKWFHL